jgi:hypothetical protein
MAVVQHKPFALALLAIFLLSALAPTVGADPERKRKGFLRGLNKPDTFIHDDDYKEGEEIIHAVLEDKDYSLMVEDVERHGVEFDWGWARAANDKPARPEPDWAIGDYATVRVLPVPNKALKVAPDIEEATHGALSEAMRLLGLEVVEGAADLELEMAVVDYKSDSTYIFVGTVDPFFEIEGRLREVTSGDTLFLVRHQEHGTTPETAAADFAGDLAKFLR